MVLLLSLSSEWGQVHKRRGVAVAICPRLEPLFDSSYLVRKAADLPVRCDIPRGHEQFIIGVCFSSAALEATGYKTSGPGPVLLLFKSCMTLVGFGSTPGPQCIPLGAVEFIESGTLIGERGFSIVTTDSVHRFQYRTCDEACVQTFLYDLRHQLMTVHAGGGLTQGISCGAPLELKFACAEADEIDPGEAVLIRFFSPHVRAIERHHWFWHRAFRLPADYLGLTTRRLMWLSD